MFHVDLSENTRKVLRTCFITYLMFVVLVRADRNSCCPTELPNNLWFVAEAMKSKSLSGLLRDLSWNMNRVKMHKNHFRKIFTFKCCEMWSFILWRKKKI